ncbi:hemin uptake protein HemP [Azospirillum sp.]|uniref:hemin uptake protein HemP n=1 Tax=Azospirillum sp. TaxID=34012 RepID=UPI003D71A25B
MTTENADPGPQRPGGDASAEPGAVEVVEAADLLRGANEIVIRHAGQNYRLRITRANKLLLIK